ncbi:Ribonuclease 3 [Poriferisphaera corsica]|uniref:Ribonuclease 3 n=1 Tax=Poriferisphaera corsica TaxID=2528020 RepID=A0A517YUG8_9BACT|nr:ribonuclease III [Poriferisphaera corsica]QDU33873.1 Ribonuclease 3 [Poriferisphaera corsica]
MNDVTRSLLQYTFKQPEILQEALTHASYADSRLNSNERMEFLGDAILGFVVCEYLYANYPELLEGELTKIKSAVVSRRTCALISEQTGLVKLLELGKGMIGRPSLPSSVAAAVYESVIAAIYLDGGMEAARQYILRDMTPIIEEAEASSHQENFKSVLQQYAQKHMPFNPIYVLLDEKGPDHAKCFEVAVDIDGRKFTSSWANSKKEAEQKAALHALVELGLAEVSEQGHVTLLEKIKGPDIVASSNDEENAE